MHEQAYLDQLQAKLPELPYPATLRLERTYPGLTAQSSAALLALDPEGFAGIAFYERAVEALGSLDGAKALANWTINYVAGALAKEGKTWDGPGAIAPEELAELVRLVEGGKMTRAPFFLPPPSHSSTLRRIPG